MAELKKRGMSENVSYGILIAFCILVMLVIAYPLYYVLVASFSDPYHVYGGKTFLFPSGFSLKGYEAVFQEPKILSGLLNSVKYTTIGTLYAVTMVFLVAYPLSKKDLPFRRLLSLFFVITMYFGGGLIPTYLVVQKTGLIGNIWALFLPGAVGVGNVILVRNFFENSIPLELSEAAEIDGASQLRVFLQIVLPLSRSILAVMAVFSMVAYWNDWFTPMIYLKRTQASLPLVLRDILTASSITASQSSMISGGYAELNKISESIKFASIVIAATPMLIAYPFVQKYFEQGFLAGSVKG